MPVADTKRVQTLINTAGALALELKAVATALETVRTKYNAASPAVVATGTPLAGQITAVSNWITSVRSAADAAIATTLINAMSGTHQGKALD